MENSSVALKNFSVWRFSRWFLSGNVPIRESPFKPHLNRVLKVVFNIVLFWRPLAFLTSLFHCHYTVVFEQPKNINGFGRGGALSALNPYTFFKGVLHSEQILHSTSGNVENEERKCVGFGMRILHKTLHCAGLSVSCVGLRRAKNRNACFGGKCKNLRFHRKTGHWKEAGICLFHKTLKMRVLVSFTQKPSVSRRILRMKGIFRLRIWRNERMKRIPRRLFDLFDSLTLLTSLEHELHMNSSRIDSWITVSRKIRRIFWDHGLNVNPSNTMKAGEFQKGTRPPTIQLFLRNLLHVVPRTSAETSAIGGGVIVEVDHPVFGIVLHANRGWSGDEVLWHQIDAEAFGLNICFCHNL